jgi:ABC-type transport system involved in cytochrome c biogenesis permease component
MSFLPIVERELRLAARKWAAFITRIVAAVITVVIGSGFMMLTLAGLMAPNELGSRLFAFLTWLAFIVAALAGVFFTSDSISEERREGTLGLLFLTDLRGHDVVLGKLVSNSLRASYGLLATFPIVALALIMGGVTGGEFGRKMLALLLTLGFSLTAGLCLSSFTSDGRRALGGTLLVMLLATLGTLSADGVWCAIEEVGFEPRLSWVSPAWMFTRASAGKPEFWLAAAVCAGLSLAMLAAACWKTPRGWQEAAKDTGSREKGLLYDLRYGTAEARVRRRRKLLPVNPLLWFCGRLRWRGAVVSTATVAGILAVGFMLAMEELREAAIFVGVAAGFVMAWVMYFWMASESARFFVESRRNGALELLLSTPLTGRDVVRGLRGALWRLFLVPVLLLAALQMTTSVAMLLQMRGNDGAFMALVGVPFFGIGGGFFNIITRIADLVAIGWVGIWMGLTSRNANLAVLKTLLFVQVLPWLVSMFITPFMMLPMMFLGSVAGSDGQWLMLLPMVLGELLWIGKDFIFIRWASSRLETDLRILALPESARVWSAPAPAPTPPPLPV